MSNRPRGSLAKRRRDAEVKRARRELATGEYFTEELYVVRPGEVCPFCPGGVVHDLLALEQEEHGR